MAQLIPYLRKKGTTYGVKWRLGGSGPFCHETFDTEAKAKFFKRGVEQHHHQYPPNYVKKLGYVDPRVLAEQKARLAREAEEASRAKPIYFSDRFEAFLATVTATEERTIVDYRHQYANHFAVPFGHLAVNDDADVPEEEFWDADKVKAWVNDTHRGVRNPAGGWERQPKAAKTVRNLHALLSSYGAWLVEKKLRAANPCAGTRLPESEEGDADAEMVFLERYEYEQLLDCFPEQEARDLVEFLAGTGLRYGEATALKIKDLRLDPPGGDTPHLLVRRAWKRQPNGSHKEGRPKSKASRRRVELDANRRVLEVLRRVIAGRSGEEYVFLTPTGVHWRHANFFNRPWMQGIYKLARCDRHRAEDGIGNMHNLKRRHVVPCGCPGTLEKVPRIHDLRHSYASWLIERGVSLVAIQRQLGHESYRTTEKRYAHLTSGTKSQMGAAAPDPLGAAALSRRHRPAEKRQRRQRAFGPRGAVISTTGAR